MPSAKRPVKDRRAQCTALRDKCDASRLGHPGRETGVQPAAGTITPRQFGPMMRISGNSAPIAFQLGLDLAAGAQLREIRPTE